LLEAVMLHLRFRCCCFLPLLSLPYQTTKGGHIMNMTDLATWSQAISSVAVLATLVYLFIQTKQTSALLTSESRQAIVDADLSVLRTIIDYPEVWLSRHGQGDLSMEQKVQLNGALLSFLRTREHYWTQYNNGVLDEDTWTYYSANIPAIFVSERTKNWWMGLGKQQFHPEFVEMVDDLRERMPPYAGTYEWFTTWK